MNTQELGRQVLKRRKDRGLSQGELAEKANLSRNYISLIERGEGRNVTMSVLSRLANVLETTPAELTGEVESRETLIPQALREFGLEAGLRFDVIDKLARLPRRGQQPATPQEWRQLYNAIRHWLDEEG